MGLRGIWGSFLNSLRRWISIRGKWNREEMGEVENNQLFCEKISLFCDSIIIFNEGHEETVTAAINALNIEKKLLSKEFWVFSSILKRLKSYPDFTEKKSTLAKSKKHIWSWSCLPFSTLTLAAVASSRKKQHSKNKGNSFIPFRQAKAGEQFSFDRVEVPLRDRSRWRAWGLWGKGVVEHYNKKQFGTLKINDKTSFQKTEGILSWTYWRCSNGEKRESSWAYWVIAYCF